ncbi:MAG: hypothetical protein WCV83_03485 [Candidatus Magasanikbacteria bacterium]
MFTNQFPVTAETSADDRTQLENQLKNIEEQIAQYEKELKTTQTEKKSLTAKINSLKNTQAALKLQIKKTTLVINELDGKITLTEKQITQTKNKTDRLKDNIGTLINLIDQKDKTLLIEILTTENNLAEFYSQVYSYNLLSQTIGDMLDTLRTTQKQLSDKQVVLEDQQDDAKNLLSLKTLQQQQLLGTISEQADLLKTTQGKETEYQKSISDTKKLAAEIKNRIYEMIGGSKQINFGEAVDLANWVNQQTGVRTAFLLAILTQESSLGKNIGTCNRPNDPPEKGWRVIMKPTRDQEPFQTITGELGKDTDITPVSCPMKDSKGKQVGWGGAMGPAQFIPSTWMGYRNKVTAITGNSVASPWDNRDAFLASALLLKANGADGTENGEWKAAMRYFSGGTNVAYRFYGDNVIKTTNKYIADIANLNK